MPSELIICPSIGTHHIQRNDENRVVIVDHLMIRFTPTEYRLVLLLLNGQVAPDSTLMQAAFHCEISLQTRENLDKHIDKIRSKLRPSNLNVHRVAKYGYILLEALD
jgi:DNA-binding response OmpR family regulator